MAAAKQGAESKQGLIISLVCFVLLAVILGVTTWLGYDGQNTLRESEKKAQADKGAMSKERDSWKYRALELQNLAGHLTSKTDTEALQTLRQANPQGEGMGDFTAAMQAISNNLRTQTGQLENYSAKLARVTNDLNTLKTNFAATEQALKKARDTFNEQMASKEAEVQDWQKKFQGAQAANLKDSQDRAKAYEAELARFDELSRQFETQSKKIATDNATREKERVKQGAFIKELEGRVDKLSKELTPTDWLKYDVPKGKIVRLDPRGEIAFINLGYADNLRPQQNLTFSVFATAAGGRASQQYKGSIEVLDVVDAHLAKAKITQVVDPNRSPITTGDVIVNPAWSPTSREHVAIAGLIDLTGDGRHNIDEFMTNLGRQGIVVDSYLDLTDNTLKGPGMTINTSFLIIGEAPDLDEQNLQTDPRTENKLAINKSITELQAKAKELGVTVVPLRRFVQLIGYKLPKGAGVSRRFGYDSKITKPLTTPTTPKDANKDNGGGNQ